MNGCTVDDQSWNVHVENWKLIPPHGFMASLVLHTMWSVIYNLGVHRSILALTCQVIFILAAPSVCTFWNPSDCEHKWREWQLKSPFVCTLFQDSKWVEEKQLFLQRNQVLLEKVWFNLINLTFIKTEFSACPELTIKGWRPGHCPAKGLASTSVLSKHFTQSSFAPLVRICPKLHHITVLKQLTSGF